MSVATTDRNMQVEPAALENREPASRRPKEAAPDELATLKARLSAARMLAPKPHEIHCRDCFEKGRDAALRVLDGADE